MRCTLQRMRGLLGLCACEAYWDSVGNDLENDSYRYLVQWLILMAISLGGNVLQALIRHIDNVYIPCVHVGDVDRAHYAAG